MPHLSAIKTAYMNTPAVPQRTPRPEVSPGPAWRRRWRLRLSVGTFITPRVSRSHQSRLPIAARQPENAFWNGLADRVETRAGLVEVDLRRLRCPERLAGSWQLPSHRGRTERGALSWGASLGVATANFVASGYAKSPDECWSHIAVFPSGQFVGSTASAGSRRGGPGRPRAQVGADSAERAGGVKDAFTPRVQFVSASKGRTR
jgi:hypothetical protein